MIGSSERTLHFAPGTPRAVRDVIKNLPHDLSLRLRVAVKRLAVNEEMESFWKELPTKLTGKEAEIIIEAVIAFDFSIRLRPPLKQQMKLMKEFLLKHAPITDPALLAEYREQFVSPLTYASIAVTARTLLDDLRRIPHGSRADWLEAWTGDPEITLEKLLTLMEATASCCDKLDDAARQQQAALNFPKPPQKRGGRTASEVYFAMIMQDYFRREFGQPMASTVAILSQVMFDLPAAVDESTIRKRSGRAGTLSRK